MASESVLKAKVRRTEPRRVKVIRATTFSALGLLSHLADLVQYTDLIYTLSVHRVKVRYKQSVLGASWAVMQPLSLMLIYTVIFSYIAKIPSDGAAYPIFAFTGLLPWIYFQTALITSTNGLVSHRDLITKVYFPREILPFSYVIVAFFDFLIASFVLVGLILYYRAPLTFNMIYVIPIMMILTLFTMGMSLILSATQVRFRDVGVAILLLLQLWMYATPIVYPYSAIARFPKSLQTLYTLNPLVGVIENFRRVVLQGFGPDFHLLGISLLISVLLLPVAYIYFKHIERTVADII
jgi:homopolymeric O-antigen transport system permease protein